MRIYLPYLVHLLSTHFFCAPQVRHIQWLSSVPFSLSVCVCVCVFIPFLPFLFCPNTLITQEDKVQQTWPRQCHPSLCLEGEEGGGSSVYIPILPFSACTSDCFIYTYYTSVVSTFMSDALGVSPLATILSRVQSCT